jgi:vacuolar-type H+-ATPase subunit I/STV1
VREILFGTLHRDIEQRMSRADTHGAAQLHDLEQESRRRDEVLEGHLKKEIEALANRLDGQLAETRDGLRNLTREHRDEVAQLERRIAKVEESTAAGLHEVRHQLLEQAKTFLDELRMLRKEILVTMQHELGLLEGEPSEGERGATH